jgi:hypothetical protein
VKQWVDDFRQHARGCSRADIEDPSFWQWLLDRGYADTADRTTFENWLSRQPLRRQIHVRPGIQIQRTWEFGDAAG